MSYSSLIFKDAPLCVWSLEEPNGSTIVLPDNVVNDSDYEGSFNSGKFFMSSVPITNAGSFCVTNIAPFDDVVADYATDNIMFTVPSIDIFSSKTKAKQYSLEFWMNLEINPVDLADNISSRIGESEIVTFSGATNTGLYIRDLDYLVFRLGDSGKKSYESYIHVPDFNTPLHIAMVYTPNTIQIFVNGKAGTETIIDSNPFNSYEERDIEFRFPNKISVDSQYFKNISYDTVAIYDQALFPSTLKRHYVYGVGKDVPREIFSSLGGIVYGSDMQRTLPQRQVSYLNRVSWTSNVILNNLVATEEDLSTVRFAKPNLFVKDESGRSKESLSDVITSSGVYFPDGYFSYLEIPNYESITGGSTKKVEAKFSIDEFHQTNLQTILHVSSRSNPSTYLSFKIENRTIKVFLSGSLILSHTLDSLAEEFFISYYVSSGNIDITVCDDQNDISNVVSSAFNVFPMQNAYLRFGSSPLFIDSVPNSNVLASEVERFDGKVVQIDIYNSSTQTSSWSSYPVNKTGVSLYQLYPDSINQRLSIATKGTFEMTVSLANLVPSTDFSKNLSEVNLATKVVIGSQSAKIKYDLIKTTGGSPVNIETNKDIRLLNLPLITSAPPNVSDVQYKISGELVSTDSEYLPGILDHLVIYSYPILTDSGKSYIDVKSDSSGDNVRYYSGQNNLLENYPFKRLPDIDQTTDLYRSFNTGFTVGEFYGTYPYVKIPFNTSGISSPDEKIYLVMFTGILKSGSKENMNLLKIGSTQVSWATPEPSGVELYINGSRYSESTNYNQKTWNLYAVKFTSGVTIPQDIEIGYGVGSGWVVDNLSVFTTNVTSSDIGKMYKEYFGTIPTKVVDGHPEPFIGSISEDPLNPFDTSMLLLDSEKSNGNVVYQPLVGQEGFYSYSISPRLASTVNIPIVYVSGNVYSYTFNLNRDSQKIDNVEPAVGDVILLKDQINTTQNGIYIVTAKTTTSMQFTKQTDPPNKYLVFVKEGFVNKNYYFQRNSTTDTYSNSVVQRKVSAYDKNGYSSITTVTVT